MKQSDLDQASIWGIIFEIAVKRGVIAYLLHRQLLTENHPHLTVWKNYRISHLTKQLKQALKNILPVQDTYIEEWVKAYLRHLLVLGYGLGWTSLRECLKVNNYDAKTIKLEAIWCPLTLPGESDPRDIEREKTIKEFHQIFGLSEIDPSLIYQGEPARADFLLWLSPLENNRKKTEDLILCYEFSFNAPLKFVDFNLENSHCQEINRYARYLDSRGCFSRICAQVEGDQLQFSSKLEKYLIVFSGKDKPLYKLCQASSYTEKLVKLLQKKERLLTPCLARAMAITSNGIESLSAHFNTENNPQVKLMQSLGKAYQNMRKIDEPEDLNQEIKLVFKKLLLSLPAQLKKQASTLQNTPNFAHDFNVNLTETVTDFFHPAMELSPTEIINAIEETEVLKSFFQGSPSAIIQQHLSPEKLNLRDAHKTVIKAGLHSAQKGRLNVIALEGNPGIGKTSSVVDYLTNQSEGFLFIYVSPRVVINRNVTQDLAEKKGEKTGILTITTNSKLISSAPKWYEEKQGNQVNQKAKNIDSAVVINGVESTQLKLPETGILFITPEEEREIDDNTINAPWYKKKLNEREQQANTKNKPGVLRTLATSARFLLKENPAINQLVLTAATQGYRNLKQGTTITALNNLFEHKIDSRPGIKERQQFSQKINHIMVMIDEVTGDGAGALFVHEIAKWLDEQFIKQFKENPLFKVTLIVADASLSNEIVLSNFLDSGERVPDKILISPSQGNFSFRVTGTQVKIGNKKQPTLHLMTNSFPANQLTINYSIRLASIQPELDSDGQKESIRKAIRQQAGDKLLNNAYCEIKKAQENQAQQIIFFAQDKAFLRQLQELLTVGEKQLFLPDDVAVLDASVSAYERLKLVTEKRDLIKVFLMTSSGARGVSFPKADWIIASFPRFNVEASLMEIGQLIYRGRGKFIDKNTGKLVSGEHISRHLVLLINDFLITEENVDLERQWLRQSSDLLSLLLMLRSTIFTRIKGDANLPKQSLAFVPVGGVGEDELLTLIADEIQNFLREAQVFISDSKNNNNNKDVVKKAEQLIETLFSVFDLIGKTSKTNLSFTNYATLETFIKAISRPSTSFLTQIEDAIIPDHLSCLGSFWWENWGDRHVQEKYSFSPSQGRENLDYSQLMGCLSRINKGKDFPSNLRRPAKSLYQLLKQDNQEIWREYATLKEIDTNNLVIVLPLDYPQFWKMPSENEEIITKQVLEDPLTWRNALGRTLTSGGIILPVIPHYRSFPWVAIAGSKGLSQLEQIFDNRYFMASSELNLLNTILFEDEA